MAPPPKQLVETPAEPDEELESISTKAAPVSISPYNIGQLPPPIQSTTQPTPITFPPATRLPPPPHRSINYDVVVDDEIADLTQGHPDDDVIELSKVREKNRRRKSKSKKHRRRKDSSSSSSASSQLRSKTKSKRRRREKHHDRSFIPIDENEVPDDHVLIKTSYGYYIVPKYDEMSADQQQIHRETFVAKFRMLNDAWKGMKITFDLPKPEESLAALHVRYKQAVKYVNARSGASIFRIFLILGWLAFEFIAIHLNIPAHGYTKSQMAMYDLYQTQMIELGEIGGFGQDWHPITKVAVLSLINAALFIVVAYFFGNGNNVVTTELMRMASGFVLGQNVKTDTNSLGVPTPVEQPNVANMAGSMGGLGGLGGIGDMLGNLMGGAGGGDNPMGGVDFGDIVGNLGSMLTGNMQNNRMGGGGAGNAAPARRTRQTRGPSLHR